LILQETIHNVVTTRSGVAKEKHGIFAHCRLVLLLIEELVQLLN